MDGEPEASRRTQYKDISLGVSKGGAIIIRLGRTLLSDTPGSKINHSLARVIRIHKTNSECKL